MTPPASKPPAHDRTASFELDLAPGNEAFDRPKIPSSSSDPFRASMTSKMLKRQHSRTPSAPSALMEPHHYHSGETKRVRFGLQPELDRGKKIIGDLLNGSDAGYEGFEVVGEVPASSSSRGAVEGPLKPYLAAAQDMAGVFLDMEVKNAIQTEAVSKLVASQINSEVETMMLGIAASIPLSKTLGAYLDPKSKDLKKLIADEAKKKMEGAVDDDIMLKIRENIRVALAEWMQRRMDQELSSFTKQLMRLGRP